MKADFEKGIKICSYCREGLSLDSFCKNKSCKDGLNAYCRKCANVKKSLRLREDPSAYLKKKEYDRRYHDAHDKKVKRNQKDSFQRRKDPQFQFIEKFRVSLYNAMQNNRETAFVVNYLGCSIKEFKAYLESLFLERMSWELRGKHIENWSIDHFVPYNHFDLTVEENRKICCHYLNCTPVWNKINLSKNANLPENYREIINQIKNKIYGNL